MKPIERLLQFAKAIYILLLATVLILLGRFFSEGGANPISTGLFCLGLVLIIPGLLFGLAGFVGKSMRGGNTE